MSATAPDVPEQRQGVALVQVAGPPHCTSSISTTGTIPKTSQPLCDSVDGALALRRLKRAPFSKAADFPCGRCGSTACPAGNWNRVSTTVAKVLPEAHLSGCGTVRRAVPLLRSSRTTSEHPPRPIGLGNGRFDTRATRRGSPLAACSPCREPRYFSRKAPRKLASVNATATAHHVLNSDEALNAG